MTCSLVSVTTLCLHHVFLYTLVSHKDGVCPETNTTGLDDSHQVVRLVALYHRLRSPGHYLDLCYGKGNCQDDFVCDAWNYGVREGACGYCHGHQDGCYSDDDCCEPFACHEVGWEMAGYCGWHNDTRDLVN